MRGELFFEIPDDQDVIVRLVETIPPNWSWVDGGLHAPKSLIASGTVQEDTGFAVERFHSIHPTIIGSYDQSTSRRREPDLVAIMVEQKLPGFIRFDEAGYDANISLELAKRIAVGFLHKGYRGDLYFYSGCYDNGKYNNPARCEMRLEPWHGASVSRKEAGPQPPRVKLMWEGCYNGKEDDIAPIVVVCRSLNLREYTPVAPVEVAL